MPTISAKIITPRKDRFCGSYAHSGDDLMPRGVPHMRLYGNGNRGDPKYTMYICLDCADKSADPKIIDALSTHKYQKQQVDFMDEQSLRVWVTEIAMQHYGRWYIWGGDDPSGFDCSGFAIEVLKSVGVLPRRGDWTAAQLCKMFTKTKKPAAGDLVFWRNKKGDIIHVEICLSRELSIGASGGGPTVKNVKQAIKQNAFIKIRPLASRSGVWGYCNPYKR